MQSDLNEGNSQSPSGDLGVHLQNPIFKTLSTIADKNSTEAYVIGGFVRDLFLDRPSKDIDVVVVGSGIAYAEAIGRKLNTKVAVFKNFGTANIKYQDLEIENKKLLRINKLGKDEILNLRSQNESLIKQINDLRKNMEAKENKQNVFYIRDIKS